MRDNADFSLETELTDPVAEATAPAQPVVVVQYRSGRLPWGLMIAVAMISPAVAVVFYHRLVVAKLPARAAEASRDFQEWAEEKRLADQKTKVAAEMGPLALNSQPIGPTPSAPVSAPPPVDATPPAPQAAKPTPGTPSSVATAENSPPRPSPTAPPAVAADVQPTVSPAGSPSPTVGKTIVTTVEPPGESPFDLGQDPPTASPPEPVRGAVAISPPRDDRDGKPAQPVSPPIPNEPAVAKAEQPLPTKEEFNRQIQEESAAMRAERQQLAERKEMELRELRNQERIKFRDELQDAISQFGRRAGPEIDKICRRHEAGVDREILERARLIWFSSGRPIENRIRLVRSLGVSEATIVNFLCASLDPIVGQRDGPRDRNEVRVRAARTLLRFALPEPGAAERPPARRDGGTASMKLRPANGTAEGTAARPR